MRFVCNRFPVASLLLLIAATAPQQISATSITASTKPTPSSNLPATCEFRTINYITDSLPRLCFRSSWGAEGTSTRVVAAETASGEGMVVDAVVTPASSATKGPGEEKEKNGTEDKQATPSPLHTSVPAAIPASTESGVIEDLEASELNEASFLSFEEWKKQALEKAGQQNAQIGGRKANPAENKRRDPDGLQNSLGPYGEEGEIDIDFGAFRNSGDGQEESKAAESQSTQTPEVQLVEKKERRREHRSKDAGKTCKERFSYASFDAGATVVKTHKGAKNSKAVLIENKDSYMLSECSKENKFIIIELSEDIWIDTVVLANYEFFSSMIRTFRVTVSDKYPLKTEKWRDIGVYEARNSRDIQAFLIENPQIWARYIRIEFLSHYGNEYYCPLSLVRVHGTRMLESWRESEAIGEDDDAEEDIPEIEFVPEAVAEVVQKEERRVAEMRAVAQEMVETAHASAIARHDAEEKFRLENGTSPWIRYKFPVSNSTNTPIMDEICLPEQAPIQEPSSKTPPAVPATPEPSAADRSITMDASILTERSITPESSSLKTSTTKVPTPVTSIATHLNVTASSSDAVVEPPSQQVTTQPSKTHVATSTQKNKTSSTSSSSSSLPTQQESFFKAVSRRLQLLETNSTLSLKYIEEQSRILREAFSKVEKKQTQKSTVFLDTLNNTVLAELRGFRQQYDEIWQSTIISLESQREESRREIFAISARLNILADEVVFQKRMSIVQSVLLLLCLGLVIFSRVSSSGQVEIPNFSARFLRSMASESPMQSPAFSPVFPRMDSMRSERSWGAGPGPSRPQSGEYGISRSRSRDGTQTPISNYSRSDYDYTPPPPEENPLQSTECSPEPPRPERLEPPRTHSFIRRTNSGGSGQSSPRFQSYTQSPPNKRSRKRRGSKNSLRQLASPPATDNDRASTTSRDTPPAPLDIAWVNRSQIGLALSSPPPEEEERDEAVEEIPGPASPTPTSTSFHIARKPLPALPPQP
ncbi:hypothetical protein HYALB_00003270 [Hymenoscyphus albidus]|uniref:SUN domain-containing protein n=1 Tax=Hymenoscyphus albidus TaxID=595503 RepID=A0A9N9LF04_9HELO|nr:hypothetical protein HYALB_00003270 [Hymenoscyphus albidus]